MENEYKDLGVMNGWKSDPVEYSECVAKGHKRVAVPHESWRCYTFYHCEECKIRFAVDSSD